MNNRQFQDFWFNMTFIGIGDLADTLSAKLFQLCRGFAMLASLAVIGDADVGRNVRVRGQ